MNSSLPKLLKHVFSIHNFRCSYSSFSVTVVHQIAKAFHHNNFSFFNSGSLPNLQPAHLEPVVFQLRSNPTSALRFFEWAENFLGLRHPVQSFCGIAHVLLRHRMFDPATRVFDRMVRQFGNLEVLGMAWLIGLLRLLLGCLRWEFQFHIMQHHKCWIY